MAVQCHVHGRPSGSSNSDYQSNSLYLAVFLLSSFPQSDYGTRQMPYGLFVISIASCRLNVITRVKLHNCITTLIQQLPSPE